MFGKKETHESFGQISISRTNSTGMNFYGSELTQQNYISIEINQSEIQRDITQDRYYNTKPILRLRMSSIQFAEAITSLNMGSGVPCTIERLMGQKVEEHQGLKSREATTHDEFKERMIEFNKKLQDRQSKIKQITEKSTISKQDRQEINDLIRFMNQEISQNIPYFTTCFQETMDNVVLEAKTEVESAILHKVNTLGLQALHQENKLLTNGKEQ